MNEKTGMEANCNELKDDELEKVVGGYSAGDVVVYKEYTKCPRCLASIPCATLKFYRGLDPNSERAWIVQTGCCGTTYSCVESAVKRA